MPDGNGVPHLVDLQAPVQPRMQTNEDDNEYWLFTRKNDNEKQVLKFNDSDSVRQSNYDPNLPLTVIVHGWNNNGDSNMNLVVRSAFLHVGQYNVIVVDWSKSLSICYTASVKAVPNTGKRIGRFLEWLINNFGGNWDSVHMVGHSLGAHVVGNAGRAVSGKVARITGMDPAGPQFGGNPAALNGADARYVECIHTDGGVLGIYDPICQSNFYPNGGKHPQPGCLFSPCSHTRSYEFFSASVKIDNFIGTKCGNLDELKSNVCNGSQLRMGNTELYKNGTGLYRLKISLKQLQ
ncbi:unnamed protein product [Leptosia nina]|uniref:Lipase domain-containing protein n=1 Tax=Leptosia nina TaxID=320188 RepID=A0AAV1J553_9NEOP